MNKTCHGKVVLTQLKKGAFFGELAVMFAVLAMLCQYDKYVDYVTWQYVKCNKNGSCFMECQDMPRTASVRAATAVTALSLTREARRREFCAVVGERSMRC